ncbi:SNARE associated Golgi protein [Aureococcus anophagefferens]|nr:SNARE associated Golgi protein [Aureococcus anophagefferens]
MATLSSSTALATSASAMECDDAPLTSEDAALIASIVSILEREGDLNEASCAGRRALEETLDARDALAEGGEEPDGVVEALEAIAAIWELCEIGFFDVARRRGRGSPGGSGGARRCRTSGRACSALARGGVGWRLGARLLLLGDDRAGYRALLARADPADDAGAWELARLAAAEGQAADAARLRLAATPSSPVATSRAPRPGTCGVSCSTTMRCGRGASARAPRSRTWARRRSAPFAVDGRLETLCGAEAASLVAAFGAALAGGAPEAFEAAANRAAAVADALGRDARRTASGPRRSSSRRATARGVKLLRLARVALAAVAGDAFGAGFRERAALAVVGAARWRTGSAVAEELTALLAFVLHVLRRAAASQPDPLRYVASGPPAKPPFGSNDCLVLLDATQRNADRRDAGLLDDGALATLNHLLVEALAVAFAFENHDDRERNLPAMDLGERGGRAAPQRRGTSSRTRTCSDDGAGIKTWQGRLARRDGNSLPPPPSPRARRTRSRADDEPRRWEPCGARARPARTWPRARLERTTFTPARAAFAGLAVLFLLAETASQGADVTLNTVFASLPSVDPKEIINGVADEVEKLGPLGPLYFSVVYVLAEVLALPAVPLTASAGYLFGAVEGTAVVLFSATIAAGASFLIGRSLLRKWVEGIAAESEQFQAIDRAVAAEGFKIILLLRLSPIFPFALSNYFYGLTAVEFGPYLAATLLGFAPGTFLYVYSGEVASLVTAAPDDGGGAPFPWYFYAGFLSVGAFIAAKVTEVATAALEERSGIVKEDA